MKYFEKHPLPIVITGVIGVSLSAIFVRYSQAPALITAAYRLIWTVLIMTPAVLANKKVIGEIKNMKGRALLLCAASGIFLAFHFSLWFESLNLTSVASSTAIVCTEVIWVALGYCIFMKGQLVTKAKISIAITVAGSIVIAMADGSAGGNSLYGDFLALLSALFSTVYTLIGKQVRKNLSTTAYTFIVYFFCAVSLCIMIPVSNISFTGYGWSAIIVGLLLCVFSTLLGHSIFNWAIKYYSPSFIAAIKLCQPAIAAVFAFILFSEIPSLHVIIGSIITIAGVVIYSKTESE